MSFDFSWADTASMGDSLYGTNTDWSGSGWADGLDTASNSGSTYGGDWTYGYGTNNSAIGPTNDFGQGGTSAAEGNNFDWAKLGKYAPGLASGLNNLLNNPSDRGSGSKGSTSHSEGGSWNHTGKTAEGLAAQSRTYEALLKLLDDGSFTRDNAIKDSASAVAEIFKQYKTNDLPKIYNSMITSGGYNGTSQQLLANDAFGNATAKGAALQLNAIVNYAKARNDQLTPLIQLLNQDRESEGGSSQVSDTVSGGGPDASSPAAKNAQTKAAIDLLSNIFGATGDANSTDSTKQA